MANDGFADRIAVLADELQQDVGGGGVVQHEGSITDRYSVAACPVVNLIGLASTGMVAHF